MTRFLYATVIEGAIDMLPYVPDKLAALQNMKRVLVPGGRLVFTVWSVAHPHTGALAGALRYHVSSEAATSCLAPFAWGDADTIWKLVNEVAFHDIKMEVIESTSRMSSSADSVRSFIESMAVRLRFAREIEEARIALEQEVSATLQTYRVGDEFLMPSKAHLVQARAA